MTSERDRSSATPPASQSIPLRELSQSQTTSREEDDAQETQVESRHGRSQSWFDRVRGPQYARIDELSPTRQGGRRDRQTISGLSIAEDGDEVYSPISTSFAHAHVGLSFPTESQSTSQMRPTIVTTSADDDMVEPVNVLSPSDESDRTPLTADGGLKPTFRQSPGAMERMSRRSSVRWAEGSSPYQERRRSSRLGDDLPAINTNLGLHRAPSTSSGISRLDPNSARNSQRSGSRSPSPSPLARANSMLREMSQRVVNISNDTDMVDQALHRKSTSARRPRSSSLTQDHGDVESAPGTSYDQGHRPGSPLEKTPSVEAVPEPELPIRYPNPLRGKSLGVFGPDNVLRKFFLEVLTHPITEPVILILIVLQMILLAVNSASDAEYLSSRSRQWGRSSFDYAILALFIIYTIEITARVIVSGLLLNPTEYSVLDRSRGFRQGILHKFEQFFSLQYDPGVNRRSSIDFHPTFRRAFTGLPDAGSPGHGRQKQRIRLSRRAFLRHSFNRLDMVAVVSYWISISMQLSGYETDHHLYIFSMLSCLRILRLLGLTAGTSIILRSLKKAAPLLVNVAFLICFFWLIFAIIGIQSFKSSLRRTCVWVGDDGSGQNYTQNIAPGGIQFCGGYLDAVTGLGMPWLKPDGSNGTTSVKGFLCPQNSLCVEGSNPYNGTLSFDNIGHSLELVFVVISSNTWSDTMYYLADSDYLLVALFFAAGIVVLSLWLVNLLVAVITSSFQIIREESRQSAFTTHDVDNGAADDENIKKMSSFRKWYEKTNYFWIAIIVADLVVMACRSADMSPRRESIINNTETVVTFLLLLEIVLRFLSDWRGFFRSKRNIADLLVAIITSVMQIPLIRNSGTPYAWMSFFQIVRIYRVVLGVKVTRELVMIVFTNIGGLVNLILFVVLFTFMAGILATQLFRGDLPPEDNAGNTIFIQFYDIWNSFIGMYIIFSSENWTSMVYNIQQYNHIWKTGWIGVMFCITWFVVANLIVLNMFIAVIQESFDVSEDEKRMQQVKAYLRKKEVAGSAHGGLSVTNIFKMGRDSYRHRDAHDFGGAAMEQLLKDAVVHDFLDEGLKGDSRRPMSMPLQRFPTAPLPPSFLRSLWTRLSGHGNKDDPNPFYTDATITRVDEEFDARAMAQKVVSTTETRKKAQRGYLMRHPNYNVSLFVFRTSNPIRKACQLVVGPGRGDERIEGNQPSKPLWYPFSAFTYMAIVAMVIIACITTPLYQREYLRNTPTFGNWILWTDLAFAIVFLVEALIKIIADGFFYTPHAYFRNIWGVIDVIVLMSLWINVFTQMFRNDSIARGIGAFKALRALRLLNISDSARKTFHAVIVVGGYKVMSAAFVSLSLLVPFAILGLNLFNGKLQECNDGNFGYPSLDNCVGEFNSTPFNWPVLAPREVSTPSHNFDDFGSALFLLFQIASQEGWTGVMQNGMAITGRGLQPQQFASQGNAVYFIIFNLLGAVFVLTLFISVFMRNYTEQTGVAFLTAEQRSWLELRKLLKHISPSKRSVHEGSAKWKKWCFELASKKRGRWARSMTGILILHLALLVIEFYPEPEAWETIRTWIFLILTLLYIFNIFIRITGLTWARFRRSSWDLYSLPAVFGSFVTSVMAVTSSSNRVIDQLHKLFLVSVTFLLIPRNNQLDQLFKTAAASLPLIGNLLATWFVLFLVYAIALTQAFGLTRFGDNETGNINFRTVPKALILLFRMSIGEGWNDIMEDFASIDPPFCVLSDSFYDSDCGSSYWARGLFVSWNLISMYIFVSLFVSLIFESFSYVYQRSGGLSIISRDEIRRFKQAWAEFDPAGTGYIPKERFPRLLGELSGVFQMRIYEGDFTVRNIIDDCSVQPGDSGVSRRIVAGIDLDKFNERLNHIPVDEIRYRRRRMATFYNEMLGSADPDRGISFTTCLMVLAHYNVITDSKNLQLEEFLRRRARLQLVEQSINRDIVAHWFEMVTVTRKYRRKLRWRDHSRVDAPPMLEIPEIFVENPDDSNSSAGTEPHDFTESSPLHSPRRAPQLPPINTTISRHDSDWSLGSLSPGASPRGSPTATPRDRTRLGSIDTSYHGGGRSPPLTPSLGARHSRQNSARSGQGIMESFDTSAWGESIRRSFTIKRRSDQRGGS